MLGCGTTPSATAHPPLPDTHPPPTRPEHPDQWKGWTDQRLRHASDINTHDQFESRSHIPLFCGLRLRSAFRATRAETIALVDGLTDADWIRKGTVRGTANSVLDFGSWLANHDVGHLAQARR